MVFTGLGFPTTSWNPHVYDRRPIYNGQFNQGGIVLEGKVFQHVAVLFRANKVLENHVA